MCLVSKFALLMCVCMGNGSAERINNKIVDSGGQRVAAGFPQNMMKFHIFFKNRIRVGIGADQCFQFIQILFQRFSLGAIFIKVVDDKFYNICFKYLSKFIEIFTSG